MEETELTGNPETEIWEDIGKRAGVKRKVIIISAVIAAIFSSIIYLNETFWKIDWIPSWREIYTAAGLSDKVIGEAREGEIAVHFIDVGQGDCALITVGDRNVLIDGGEISAAPDIINYLDGLKIFDLDMVVATHPHSDHIGSLHKIISEYGAETLVMPELTEDLIPVTSSYVKLLDTAEEKGTVLEYAHEGDRYDLADGCFLEILAPVKDYEDLNNYSIVARLTYGETAFLFTGDIEHEAERDIYESGADISADIIKIAHHGSKTSSLKVFMQAVQPDYAVISVGSPNDYGHPHKETTDLLSLLGITVYRTDLDGNIVWFSNGKTLRVETEKVRTQ